jgi:acetyl esterase/lipase
VSGLPDLVYSTLSGFRPLTLDLYVPANPVSGGAPVIIYVHGGGWMSGHTRHSGAFENWPGVLASLAGRGYVVASLNYRLSSEAPSPAAEQDVKSAVRWAARQRCALRHRQAPDWNLGRLGRRSTRRARGH